MDQKKPANWLKFIIVGAGAVGLLFYAYVIPAATKLLFADHFLLWDVFLWITALPFYAVLVCAWRVASNIGNNRSFSCENAKLFKIVTVLSAADTVFFLAGSISLSLDFPVLLAFACVVSFAGIAVTVASAVLVSLISKAAQIQEENEFTI